MSAAAWTRRRAKRDLSRGRWTRHVERLLLRDLADLGYTVRIVLRDGERHDVTPFGL